MPQFYIGGVGKMKYKVASLFAGVGGIELGFELTDRFETIYANEFDKKASITYNANHSIPVDNRDIHEVEPDDIPDIDVLTSGFPCTSFSIAGYRKGFEDERSGDLFFETLRIVKAKRPKVVFLENVKNLVGHDNGKTFKIICDALEQNGYHLKYKVMNATEYGNVPQNRERIYVVAFKNRLLAQQFEFPRPIPLERTIHDIVDVENKVDDKYYYTADGFKQYDQLEANMTNPDTVYQWRRKYVRENQSNVVPTLTANMGTGGHNVPLIITNYGFRKLTPRETFLFQGYPRDFVLPDDVAMTHQYKQAGNSVVVPVIERIALQILKVLEENEIPAVEIMNLDHINIPEDKKEAVQNNIIFYKQLKNAKTDEEVEKIIQNQTGQAKLIDVNPNEDFQQLKLDILETTKNTIEEEYVKYNI